MSTSTQISGIPGVEHDRISNLPDCVITLILSRLPTKDAGRTSVLSKDWEYKWTSIHNIDLDDRKAVSNASRKTTFVNIVERMLLLPQPLQSFRITCYGTYDFGTMKTWITAALSRDVNCLCICYCAACIDLPYDLLNSYTLRKLEVNISRCTYKVPAKTCFYYLTFLELANVAILNENFDTEFVKFNFPILETLRLRNCKWLNVEFVEIYAPKMTTLWYETSWNADLTGYSIEIIGDNLVKFDFSGGLPENIVLSDTSEVVYADLEYGRVSNDLDILEKSGLRIGKLLTGLSSLKDLSLSAFAVEAIALSKREVSLPKFYKMKRLVLTYLHGNTEDLLELLHSMPVLKILDLNVENWKDHDYDSVKYVPSCIISHIEILKFTCFLDEEMHGLLKLSKFFLKNAAQLKQLCFSNSRVGLPSWNYPRPILKNKIREVLSRYPKASTTVTISVT